MSIKNKPNFIESIAEKLGLIPDLHKDRKPDLDRLTEEGKLTQFPPPEQWDDWTEYDAEAHPKRVKRNYTIVPTTCFNCESACGLTAYVDKDSNQIRKFEGNPVPPRQPWPQLRQRACHHQSDYRPPDRILYPLKRTGKRGEGKWEKVTWDKVLDDIAGRIRKALQEKRHNEVAYHVGRPGHEGYTKPGIAGMGCGWA